MRTRGGQPQGVVPTAGRMNAPPTGEGGEGFPSAARRRKTRHSGEGRNPEPGRAAANGCSRPIHARVHGFAGAAPCGRPSSMARMRWGFRRGGSRTARFDGMGRQSGDCPFGRRGGSFPNDPYGIFAYRREVNPARTATGDCPCGVGWRVGDAFMRPAPFPLIRCGRFTNRPYETGRSVPPTKNRARGIASSPAPGRESVGRSRP